MILFIAGLNKPSIVSIAMNSFIFEKAIISTRISRFNIYKIDLYSNNV